MSQRHSSSIYFVNASLSATANIAGGGESYVRDNKNTRQVLSINLAEAAVKALHLLLCFGAFKIN